MKKGYVFVCLIAVLVGGLLLAQPLLPHISYFWIDIMLSRNAETTFNYSGLSVDVDENNDLADFVDYAVKNLHSLFGEPQITLLEAFYFCNQRKCTLQTLIIWTQTCSKYAQRFEDHICRQHDFGFRNDIKRIYINSLDHRANLYYSSPPPYSPLSVAEVIQMVFQTIPDWININLQHKIRLTWNSGNTGNWEISVSNDRSMNKFIVDPYDKFVYPVLISPPE